MGDTKPIRELYLEMALVSRYEQCGVSMARVELVCKLLAESFSTELFMKANSFKI